ncbi:ATP-binding cassette domain-containing protein [Kitasatospora sp. NPDC101155]|uniref:ATP-binding cassette domain-containing protein n=1 Tax=Kitasatospora sp. NPDC101155 TaxID=3364097 RepID=UPI00382F4BD6
MAKGCRKANGSLPQRSAHRTDQRENRWRPRREACGSGSSTADTLPPRRTGVPGRCPFAAERGTSPPSTFTIRERSLAALVGPSGSGKTTATKLISRFADPQSGVLRLGGT